MLQNTQPKGATKNIITQEKKIITKNEVIIQRKHLYPYNIINKLFSNAGRVVGHPPPVFGKILLQFKKEQSGAIG